jgi:predicted permease
LFAENIFPIIAVAGVGFILQRLFKIDPRPLSVTIFYSLTPALIFQLTIQNSVNGVDGLRMIALATCLVLALCLVGFGITRALKLSPVATAGFLLCTAFMNAGNYGLALNNYALGQIGLVWASLFFVTHVMLNNTLGVFIASTGKMSLRNALGGLLKVPAVYTFAIALLFRLSHLSVPMPVMKPIELMANATIPAMLLVLGMQISRSGVPKNLGRVGLAASVRLILSPLIAWLLALLLGLPKIGAQAGILEAAMPSPVLAIIISLEFDTDPDFVSAVVLLSTLLSPFTLTPLLALLSI